MGPRITPRVVKKRLSKINEEQPNKGGINTSKNEKMKLSDMMGSPWSNEELKRFYDAFRKYGKNWKKVAGAIRSSRSADMVEAIYNMNRAYLSLPEGVATAAGLIAMMTDRYNMLDGSVGDRGSDDASKEIFKLQKCGHVKFRLDISERLDGTHPHHSQNQSARLSYRCLSSVKHSGDLVAVSQPPVVGRRTPRFPVPYSCDKNDTDKIIPNNHSSKTEVDAAALTLVEASQRGGSSVVFRIPGVRAEHIRSSPVRVVKRKVAETDITYSNYTRVRMEDGCLEGSMEADNGFFTRDYSLLDIEGVGANETQKAKKFRGNCLKGPDFRSCKVVDLQEVCSSKGLNDRNFKDKSTTDISKQKTAQASQIPREGSCRLLSEDEICALDALLTLAYVPLKPFQSSGGSEPSVDVREQKGEDDSACKFNVRGFMPAKHDIENSKIAIKRDRGYSSIAGKDAVTPKVVKLGKDISTDRYSSPEAKRGNSPSISKMQERKQKSLEAKGVPIDALMSAKDVVNEVVAGEHTLCRQPCTETEIQERKADKKVLVELVYPLDEKEELLKELSHTDDVISEKQDGDFKRDSQFRKQNAIVSSLLIDANGRVGSALLHPRNLGGPGERPGPFNANYLNHQDSGPYVVETFMSSRWNARTMVDAALQAVSSLKEGEDAHMKIREAIDSANYQQFGAYSSISGIKHLSPHPGHDNSAYQYEAASCTSEPTMTDPASNPKVHVSSANEAQNPSELIQACLATLLMVQACTERRYPPAEVMYVLDHAVRSLKPSCLENRPIYREIKSYMRIIKTQMLALVATPGTSLPIQITAQ